MSKSPLSVQLYTVRDALSADLPGTLARVAELGDRVEVLPDRLLVYGADGDAVLEAVHEIGLRPVATLVRRSTLEDVFLRLTGRTLVD